MPNRATHMAVSAAITGGFILKKESDRGEFTLGPIAGALLAAFSTNLPDILEPAKGNSHHRQFFHSLVFAAIIFNAGRDIHAWKLETDLEKFIRAALLIAGGAYLTHLALDACTSRTLPLLGKIETQS